MSSCVIKNEDFYSLAEEHGIDGNELELIVHKYWNEVGKEDSFPPSSYINEQLGIGKSYYETGENVRKLWKRDYSRPLKFKSEFELNGAVQKAKTFFPVNAITTYKDNKGNFVLRIAEPVTSSSIDKEVQDILAKAPRDNQGRLLAPNGKVSNLTEKQYAQVRTKAFKEWFGDWENPFSQMTGFNIIFGHPAIGKTTALQGKYKDRVIDWDVKNNEKRDRWIEEHTKTKKGTKEFKDARNKYLIYPENYPDYIEFLTREWNRVKNKAKQENKSLLVSPHNLLKLFPNDFNYIIDVESSDFISRNINRGGDETNSKLWKEGIDKTISNVNNIPKYTIKQGVYLSDLLDSANNVSKVVDENGEPLVVYHGTSRRLNNNSFNSEFIFASDNDIISAGYGFQRKGFSVGIDYALSSFVGEDINSFRNYIDGLIKELETEIELGKDMPFYQEGDLDAKKNLMKELKKAKQEIKDRDIFKEFEFNVFNLFQNVKNPLIVDAKGKYWHSIEFEGTTKNTDEIAKIAKDRGYDGLIITNVIDKGTEVSKNGEYAEVANDYIVFNPNQIKSATDNIGTFSTTDNNVRHSSVTEQPIKVPSVTSFAERLQVQQQPKFAYLVARGEILTSCR